MQNSLLSNKIQQLIKDNPDIVDRQIKCQGTTLHLLFLKSMINQDYFVNGILKPILDFNLDNKQQFLENTNNKLVDYELLQNQILLTSSIEKNENIRDISTEVFRNKVLIFLENEQSFLSVDIEEYPVRLPTEPPTSAVVKGPREGFVEDIKTNLTLLRRRFSTENFVYKEVKVGRYSNTRIAIAYIKDIASKSIVYSVKNKLEKIDIDGIIDSYYILKFLESKKHSIFKQVGTSEKPDVVSSKLLEGRVAIIVDNSPIVLTVPFLFLEDIQSSNDYYSSNYYSTFVRIIRIFGIFLAIIGPGLYLSLRFYHYISMPYKFLVTIANSTQTIPLPPFLEIAFILLLFQILYEVSLRLPRYLGLATSIVGALILGDTGVKAGLISPPGVLIIALSMIAIYTVPDQSDQLNLLRAAFIILGGAFGIFGLIAGTIFVFAYMNSINSFGTPYLAPYSPFVKSDLKDSIYKGDITSMKTRPKSIPNNNSVRIQK